MVAVCLISKLGKSLKNLKKFSFFLFFKTGCYSFVLGNLSLKKIDYMYGCCVLDIFVRKIIEKLEKIFIFHIFKDWLL
jgi:hypothetical protein